MQFLGQQKYFHLPLHWNDFLPDIFGSFTNLLADDEEGLKSIWLCENSWVWDKVNDGD